MTTQTMTMVVGAGAEHCACAPTTVAMTHGWTDAVLAMYADVALCREELAARRPAPTTLDSTLFALTELAEYAEAARLRVNPEYVRNNTRQFDARRELAQTGEMIFTALWMLDTEERIQDAGGVLIGSVAYQLALALVAWSRGQRNMADHALGQAASAWVQLAQHVGEEPAQLLREELARIRGKFGEVQA
jgi:hypothetical protein